MGFGNEFLNMGYLDTLSYRDTFVHRIDPRMKLIVSFVFIILVISFPKYEIAQIFPFFLYPVFLMAVGDIPLKTIGKKILVVSPFVILVGVFNPFLDRNIIVEIGGVGISGGLVSYGTIILKFLLTISVALLLIATTSFIGICEGLGRLKIPDVFIVQLLFLYRYLFVLLEEAFRMTRARDSRSFGKKGYGIHAVMSLLSVLLMKTIQRAERIYGAMVARGFRGRVSLSKTHSLNVHDVVFAAGFILLFIILRVYNVTGALGDLIVRSFL